MSVKYYGGNSEISKSFYKFPKLAIDTHGKFFFNVFLIKENYK